MPFRELRGWQTAPEAPQIDWGDPINKGLLAYYPLNELGGLKCFDAVAGQHLTLTNVTTRTPGPRTPGRSLGLVTASSQYAQGTLTRVPTTEFTLCGWINLTAYVAGHQIVSIGAGAGSGISPAISIYSSAASILYGYNSDDAQVGVPSVIGRDTFVCMTQRGVNEVLYLNGRQIAARTTAAAAYSGSKQIQIGRRSDNIFYVNGALHDIRVYNRALAAGEVMRLFQEPIAGVVAPRRRIISQVAGAAGVTFITARLAATSRASAAPAASAAPSVLASSTSRVSAAPAAAAAVSSRATGGSRAAAAPAATAAVSSRATGGSRAAAAPAATAALATRAQASSRMAAAAAAAVAITARVSASSRAAWGISTGTIVQLAVRMAASSRAALAPIASAVLATRARAASRASAGSQATAAIAVRARVAARGAAAPAASAVLATRARAASRASAGSQATAAIAVRARVAARGSAAPAASAALTTRMAARVRASAVPTTTAFPHLWVPRPLWIV
jgi:hypothetical protein